jgi:hypothetical protein
MTELRQASYGMKDGNKKAACGLPAHTADHGHSYRANWGIWARKIFHEPEFFLSSPTPSESRRFQVRTVQYGNIIIGPAIVMTHFGWNRFDGGEGL